MSQSRTDPSNLILLDGRNGEWRQQSRSINYMKEDDKDNLSKIVLFNPNFGPFVAIVRTCFGRSKLDSSPEVELELVACQRDYFTL